MFCTRVSAPHHVTVDSCLNRHLFGHRPKLLFLRWFSEKLLPSRTHWKKSFSGKISHPPSPLRIEQTKSEWTNDWLIALKFSSCQGFGSSGGTTFCVGSFDDFRSVGRAQAGILLEKGGGRGEDQVGFSAKNCKTINNCSNQRISDVWGETTVVRESTHTHTHTASRLLHLGKQTKSQKWQ